MFILDVPITNRITVPPIGTYADPNSLDEPNSTTPTIPTLTIGDTFTSGGSGVQELEAAERLLSGGGLVAQLPVTPQPPAVDPLEEAERRLREQSNPTPQPGVGTPEQQLERAEAALRLQNTQPQPGQPGQGQTAAITPTQLFARFTPMVTALQLTRHADGHYTRTGGPATERYYLQTDGTIFVEGRPVPGSTTGETYAPSVITGINAGQPVFAPGGAQTPLPTTRILASLGLLRHDQPNLLQPNWTFVQGANTFRIQADGSVISIPTADLAANPNANGTVHRLAANGTVAPGVANQAPLPTTSGFAHLGLSPIRNADGSYSHPGHAGRYLVQTDGSIFYEGRTEAGGVVPPSTYVYNTTSNTWERNATRNTRLATTNAFATHHLIYLGPNRFTRTGITANAGVTTNVSGTNVPHDGLFELLANGDVIFHGGLVNGQARGRMRFPANGGAPVADPPVAQPQPITPP